MANLTYRSIKGSPLTNDELDNNFSYFTGSFTNTGTITAIGFSGSFTGSLSGSITGTATNALTASYVTASNVIGMVSSASYALTSNPFPFIGNATFSGSVLVSGSIVPNVPAGSSTSSFSLGSPTAAWKDIYVSNGTINFLNSAGQVQSTLGTGNNQLTGDTFIDGKLRQGEATLASGSFSHAEGSYSTTLGYASHAEGTSNTGLYAWDTTSTTNGLIQLATSVGNITSSFPNGTPILLDNLGTIYKYAVSNSFFAASRTQIQLTNTSVNYGTSAVISLYSQTQSPSTQLNNQTQILGGNIAHSEGSSTIALGSYSHAEGELNTALGYASHVEGNGTISQGDYQHVQGLYNITSSTAGAFILGNGTDDSNRKNLIFAAGDTVSINNILQLQRRDTNPGSPVEGMIMASGSAGSSKLFYYNGTAWVDLTA
jgi:hypothetical protein